MDLEATEFYVRSAVLAFGGRVLERLLHTVGVGRQQQARLCGRGHLTRKMQSRGVRGKTIETILGPVYFERSRYVCPECGTVEYPGDQVLGVKGTGFSPGLRRLITRAGSRESFGEAAEDLRIYGALEVNPKDVERVAETVGRQIDNWMKQQASAKMLEIRPRKSDKAVPVLYIELDGTGAPMRQSELGQTKGKAPDGRAKTREVKLGCCFTQTQLDAKGRPARDPLSTSYVGAIESSADFGNRLYAEAVRRGLRRAETTVVLSDGAEYNSTIVREHFSGVIHIIDYFHAKERLSEFLKENAQHSCPESLHRECCDLLLEGRIEDLSNTMRLALPRSGLRRKEGFKRINYFVERKEQMRYAEFRRQGLFTGSGVIEAGCKTLIGKRLKQSGMFWGVAGANAIIAARCCLYSGRFEQFWEDTGS